ncbi:Smr/MutS family protein [Wohlfahrtiimonas chitiniclastica]|uniref:Smr/MutS family protein n=1 Tax=Wohlfahrtiimonas chitiniclastica TaxID=400946 RepID=A0AB35BXE2_9GAMM|nr:Smr/MutS family protein [Wohlfahrtiimonas chitiniclastica]KZS22920.1 hypothetical protein BMY_0752 [Wohlfahrtiimonas chitiniclastica]MBS7815268.1 Smr/MutS family protein [Wohlfahrtiimonas chitiniclastica]MBS7824954.1 Smr/MutS family protein [Wohlfahrtiimonas chitiniclastica]MBS7833832.1 Smr/MutS family protein [Wohlfahrtiimonas chitiniclastica]MBS7840563.1 Smr/MutS family protein [Wohlfahrtiimonas chitiniclastica]
MAKDYQKQLKQMKAVIRRDELKAKMAAAQKPMAPEPEFASVMKDVKRIYSDRVDPLTLRPKRKVRVRPHYEEIEYDYFYIGETYEAAPIQHSKNGQGNRDVQKLQQRTYRIVESLDLHGHKMDGLDELLTEFCHYVQSKGVCGRIIHGSGLGSKNFTPILKNHVRRWLYEYPEVLAYTEERNNDGAVIFLLKRKAWVKE